MVNGKNIQEIERDDIQALMDNQIPESKSLDYKELLPGNTDADKKEFLADISSFANASGGFLIFGITEEAGIPVAIDGLPDIDADAEILRLENIIRDGLEPRISGLMTRSIPLETNPVIVMYVPKSWSSPHMIKFKIKGSGRFYSRNSAGKYPLDLSEIKAAITLSDTVIEKINGFRTKRLGMVVAGETPIDLLDGPKVIVHLIPLSAFDPSSNYDITECGHGGQYSIRPITGNGWDHRYNFDGMMAFSKFATKEKPHSYCQVFRNGIIEAVDSWLLEQAGARQIASLTFEAKMLEFLPIYLASQQGIGVEPPVILMLSIIGVSGYTFAVPRTRPHIAEERDPIDRDVLIIPEVIIEEFGCNASQTLKPIFDAIWNAAGWPGSIYYNDNGEWVDPTR